MVNEEMYGYGAKSSEIRELFEYGKKRKELIGEQNVFDFSIGNPSVPAPKEVSQAIADLALNADAAFLHGYTSAVGDNGARRAIAESLNKTYSTSFKKENIYMTCGAAASLTITFHALYEKGDEIVAFAPFFPEYKVFAQKAGYKFNIVMCKDDTLEIDLDALEKAITKNTKAVIVNSPNNPSGVVISEITVNAMCAILEKKQNEYGHPIFLISDEPYRELVYTDVKPPFLTKFYNNTIVCYSFSKSLSLPGERIGYILVPDEVENFEKVYKAVCGAGRALGYVCAPSLMQYVIARCAGKTSDISEYKKNRELLYSSLTKYGFKAARPDGAFYLFVKSPEKDAHAFCERAKKYELLLVASDSFGFPGYVRISYCVSNEMIKRSLPSFKKLAEEYGLEGE